MNYTRMLFAACLLLALNSNLAADTDDSTLSFFLKKSDLVVSGEIIDPPMGVISEVGVIRYHCKVRVTDVIKGDGALVNGNTFACQIKRFEKNATDRHYLLKKDSDVILFLSRAKQGNKPGWNSADFWFSIQPPNDKMTRSLKRLANENAARKQNAN